ncbi:MAG: SURF1 family protein [Pseudoxanthomonas sp.]
MNPWVGWALALAVAGGFCTLGFWQLGRAQLKQAMLADAQKVLDQRRPQPLSLAADATRAHDYDWAEGEGEFVDAPAVLLDNQTREGRAGVRAYRLFQPVGAPPLLVELGWLPLSGDRTMPAISRPAGKLRVQGLLMPPSAHGIASAVATKQPSGELLTIGLDAANLASSLGIDALPPRVLRLDPAMKGIGYARDLDVLPNTMPPQRHLGYAVQWFGLALAVLATATVLSFRRRRAPRAKMTA